MAAMFTDPDSIEAIDNFINEATTRKSQRIWQEGTQYLRERILPVIKEHATLPELMIINAVHQTRGRAYYIQRRITVPSWAFHKFGHSTKDNVYLTWYLSHEIAHIANYAEHGRNEDNHGPKFMAHLKRICPQYAIHHEVSYKPRNASTAGICGIDCSDL